MKLVKGLGSPNTGACWMSAVNWYTRGEGSSWSDHPDCVDPLIQALCIVLNDRTPDGEREALIGPHLFAPVGTAKDTALCEARYRRLIAMDFAGVGSESSLEKVLLDALASKDFASRLSYVRNAYNICMRLNDLNAVRSGIFNLGIAVSCAYTVAGDILRANNKESRKQLLDLILELCAMGSTEVKACNTKEDTLSCLDGKKAWRSDMEPVSYSKVIPAVFDNDDQ